MNTKISILFYGKTAKTTKDNLLPIYLRVTINGKRFEISTHQHITPSKWSVEAGRVKVNSEEVRNLNSYLDKLSAQVYTYQRELLQEDKGIIIGMFRLKWQGILEKSATLPEPYELPAYSHWFICRFQYSFLGTRQQVARSGCVATPSSTNFRQ